MMTLRRFLVLALFASGLSSCSTINKINPFSSKDDGTEAAAPETPAPKGDAKYEHALMTVDLNGTTKKVVIKLRPDLAPKHVANFQKQANSGYYDGVAVHRAIRGYLVQTGDPLTRDEGQKINWGTGGAETKISAEIKGKHVKGAVAMARLNDSLNPDKSSSNQFYIMLRTASNLDSGYTVFGEVVSGLDVIEQISAQVVDTNDVPLKRVEVESVRLVPPTAKELAEKPKKSDRGQTQTENDKGPFTKFIERIW